MTTTTTTRPAYLVGISTIRNTRSNVARWRRQLDGLGLDWKAFRARFKDQMEASMMLKIAKGLAWIDANHPGAADKGYIVIKGKASPLFLLPGTATWIINFGTTKQARLN